MPAKKAENKSYKHASGPGPSTDRAAAESAVFKGSKHNKNKTTGAAEPEKKRERPKQKEETPAADDK